MPAVTDEAALIALTTAVLNGSDIEAVIARVLDADEVPDSVDLAFRDRAKVKRAAKMAASLLPPERPLLGQSTGPAGRWTRRTAPARRAAYVLAAARRLAVGEPDIERERTYLAAHVAAENARVAAAAQVDHVALVHGPVLGWRAKLDEVTSPGCRAADSRNFRAAQPPMIEGRPSYPGSAHGGACRCRAVPPFPGAALL